MIHYHVWFYLRSDCQEAESNETVRVAKRPFAILSNSSAPLRLNGYDVIKLPPHYIGGVFLEAC
jgi:hypothetical protein